MAYIKQMETKAGKRYFQICVSRGHGNAPYKMRWYWPDGWSKRTAEREVIKVAAQFERDCQDGKVQNRKQKKMLAEEAAKAAVAAALEAAKIKTVRQYAEGVYMPTKELTLAENTRTQYKMFIDRYILPEIGDLSLKDVTSARISKLLLDFQKSGKSHSSTLTLYVVLNGIFDMAFMDDSIQISPMLKVKRPITRKDEKIKEETNKALTAKEVNYVLKCVTQEPLKWQAYMTLSADSGARRGELCGLQWKDIDWKDGSITIRRNLQYTPAKGVYIAAPKNGKTRVIDIGNDTINLLRRLRDEQAKTHVSKWVFTKDGTSDVMFPQSPTRYFEKFGERYGIEKFHPHKLRHSFASIAITNGADVVSVSERLGHSDTAVTLRMYGHANTESIRRAGQTARNAVKNLNENEAETGS